MVALFMSPFAVGLALFGLYPIGATVYYSFTDFRTGSYRPVHVVGLQNYSDLLGSSDAWTAAANTFWMVVVMVPLRTLFALLAAWVLTRLRRGATVYRTIFFLPSMVPVVASALSFIVMLNPAGPVNALLGRLGVSGPGWFGDPSWSKPSLVVMALWACGDTMVIFSAAMLDVPRDLLEAAELDGAGAGGRFWHVTLPALRPVLLFSTLTGVIYTFQYFTEAFVASGSANGLNSGNTSLGYPQQSLLFYTTEIYQQGFVYFKTGYASAAAVLLFAVIFAATSVFLRAFGALSPDPGGRR
jgi:multiple sugar transport system permease protein